MVVTVAAGPTSAELAADWTFSYLPAGAAARRDVDDERRLDAYNAWLAAMAEQDRQRQG